MNNREIRFLFMIIIAFFMTGCVETYNEDYVKKFDNYLKYSLGDYKTNVSDEDAVTNTISIGTDPMNVGFAKYKLWELEYFDVNGKDRTLVFTNYTKDHKESLTKAVLAEAEHITIDMIDSAVIKDNFPNINTDSEENVIYYSTQVVEPKNAKLISPSKVLSKKKGIKLSELEPKILVDEFGYTYNFEMIYMGTDEERVSEVTEEFKTVIKELAEYLNQDTVSFNFYKAFDKEQCFKGVYDRKTDFFEITDFSKEEFAKVDFEYFEYVDTEGAYNIEVFGEKRDNNNYAEVSTLQYIDRLINETIKESGSIINPRSITVDYYIQTQDINVNYDLTTDDIGYYTKKLGIEAKDIGKYYKSLMADVVDRFKYDNIVIKYENKYDLRYGYQGKYNRDTKEFEYNNTYHEKEDRFSTDGKLKVFCIGEPIEVMLNGEFTLDEFSGEIIYNEEKKEYYPTPKFIEKLLKNTVTELDRDTFAWAYDNKEYKLIHNRKTDKYELYENNLLILEYGEDNNEVISVEYLEKITGIDIVLNNETEGIELYLEDLGNEDELYIVVGVDEIIDAEYIENIQEYYFAGIDNYDDDGDYQLRYSSKNNNYALYKYNTKVFDFITDANDAVESLGEVTGMNVILIDDIDDCNVHLYSREDKVINSSVYIDNEYIIDTERIRDISWLENMEIDYQVVSSNFILLDEIKNLNDLGEYMGENDLVIAPGVYRLDKSDTLEELIKIFGLS